MAGKMTLTNRSRGIRGLNVWANGKDDKGGVEVRFLQPGETGENLAVVDPDDKVLRGMIDAGDLYEGTAEDVEDISPEEQAEIDAQRFANDPHQLANRAAAEAAGRTPGLSDPLPREGRERVRERAASEGGNKGGRRAKKADDE